MVYDCLVLFGLVCLVSGNFERSVMKKKLPEKKIEKVENKIIENKVNEEDKINDNICITKTSKIRGQSLYYFVTVLASLIFRA